MNIDVNPNNIQRFLEHTEGCHGIGAEALIRERMGMRPDEEVTREHYNQYCINFIFPNQGSMQLWQGMPGNSSTKGLGSWLAGGSFFEESDAKPEPTPSVPAAVDPPTKKETTKGGDPMVVKPLYTVNEPVMPRLIRSNEIKAGLDQRLNVQQGNLIPSINERLAGVLPPPQGGGGWVHIQPEYSPSLLNTGIVRREYLPQDVIVGRDAYQQLINANSIPFPPGPMNPMEGNTPIPSSMVKWNLVTDNQADINRWMMQYPRRAQLAINPPWVQQAFTAGRKHWANGQYESMHRQMEQLKLRKTHTHGKKKVKEEKKKKKKKKKQSDSEDEEEEEEDQDDTPSQTAAKSTSHASRAERHIQSRMGLDQMMRAHKTVR